MFRVTSLCHISALMSEAGCPLQSGTFSSSTAWLYQTCSHPLSMQYYFRSHIHAVEYGPDCCFDGILHSYLHILERYLQGLPGYSCIGTWLNMTEQKGDIVATRPGIPCIDVYAVRQHLSHVISGPVNIKRRNPACVCTPVLYLLVDLHSGSPLFHISAGVNTNSFQTNRPLNQTLDTKLLIYWMPTS